MMFDKLADAGEMLWTVIANVNGGDWSQQTPEWREAAAKWRDNYFAVLKEVAGRQQEDDPAQTGSRDADRPGKYRDRLLFAASRMCDGGSDLDFLEVADQILDEIAAVRADAERGQP